MIDRIASLSEILPYVREFLGKRFVVKIGGEIAKPEHIGQIARQLSLIHHIGIKLAVVHGGGPQIDELLTALGHEIKKVNGRRITDDLTLRAAKMIFGGEISCDLVAALSAEGTTAIGLRGADAGLLKAQKRPPVTVETVKGKFEQVDFGNVGDIESIDTRFIENLFAQGLVPVIGSLAADENGRILNVNADAVASAMAKALGAEKLIILTNVPGILRDVSDPASLVSYTDIKQIHSMIETGSLKDGMLPKVEACLDALRNGVPRAHILDGTRRDALLQELFLNEGVGTMIVPAANVAT